MSSIRGLTLLNPVLYFVCMNPVLNAAKVLGGQVKLAKHLGVTPQAVSQWVSGRRVPLTRVLEIAKLTGWVVTPHQLAPDVYPYPDDGLPAEARKGATDAEDAA
jgi:DNA-binding transcriptional regulator YdaS (Cro superfamily)